MRTWSRRAGGPGRSRRPAGPPSAASTGPVSRPSSRTVSGVKRSPTWRPMTANAAWLSRSGDGEVVGEPSEHDDAREDHRAEQHARGDLRARRQQGPRRRERQREHPVDRLAERRGARQGRRRARVVAAEEQSDHERRRDHDHQHAQVLHEGHEPVVRPELAGHPDDARGAARDQAERGRGGVERGGAGQHRAREEAGGERGEGHQRHREPRVGQRAQRVALQVGAEGHAGDRLARAERRRRHVHPPGSRQGDRQPEHHRREQVGRRQADTVERLSAGEHAGSDPEPHRRTLSRRVTLLVA